MEICATLPFALLYTEGNNQRVRTAFSRALGAAVRQKDIDYELRLLSGLFLLSSIDWAKRQSATLIELKASKDLAELLLKQGRMPEADKHLSAALDRTPPGIVCAAHKRARQILNRLQSGTEAVG
jgi:hypothetical protein